MTSTAAAVQLQYMLLLPSSVCPLQAVATCKWRTMRQPTAFPESMSWHHLTGELARVVVSLKRSVDNPNTAASVAHDASEFASVARSFADTNLAQPTLSEAEALCR